MGRMVLGDSLQILMGLTYDSEKVPEREWSPHEHCENQLEEASNGNNLSKKKLYHNSEVYYL